MFYPWSHRFRSAYGFKPADDKQKPTSAFFAGAIVVFDKSWRGERFSYIDRVALEAKGRASMALAQYAVGKQATAPVMDQPQTEQAETEIPLLQDEILVKAAYDLGLRGCGFWR